VPTADEGIRGDNGWLGQQFRVSLKEALSGRQVVKATGELNEDGRQVVAGGGVDHWGAADYERSQIINQIHAETSR